MSEPDRIYYDSIYFCGDRETCDWMAKIYKESDNGPWKAEYRFRYYKDGKSFDSKDEKHWYSLELTSGDGALLEKVRDAMQKVCLLMEARFRQPADIVEMQCWNDDSKWLFELGSRPWCHIKPAGR